MNSVQLDQLDWCANINVIVIFGQLSISTKQGSSFQCDTSSCKAEVVIYTPRLTQVTGSGESAITTKRGTSLRTDSFEIKLSGSLILVPVKEFLC